MSSIEVKYSSQDQPLSRIAAVLEKIERFKRELPRLLDELDRKDAKGLLIMGMPHCGANQLR